MSTAIACHTTQNKGQVHHTGCPVRRTRPHIQIDAHFNNTACTTTSDVLRFITPVARCDVPDHMFKRMHTSNILLVLHHAMGPDSPHRLSDATYPTTCSHICNIQIDVHTAAGLCKTQHMQYNHTSNLLRQLACTLIRHTGSTDLVPHG